MTLIKWNDDLYSVQIEAIDQHHKTLIGLINQLHEAMLAGRGKDIMDGILHELNDYTSYHFNAEEELMRKHSYPLNDYQFHKNEHDNFKVKLSELMEKYRNDERAISIDTFKFLKEWLLNHIQKVDNKISQAI